VSILLVALSTWLPQFFAEHIPALEAMATYVVVGRFLVNPYYMTVGAWSVFYVIASFQADLPWSSCHNDWNTRDCFSQKLQGKCGDEETFWNFACVNKTEYCSSHNYNGWDPLSDECLDLRGNNEAFDVVLAQNVISPAEDYFLGQVLGLAKGQKKMRLCCLT